LAKDTTAGSRTTTDLSLLPLLQYLTRKAMATATRDLNKEMMR
jgi:hypothetical protein